MCLSTQVETTSTTPCTASAGNNSEVSDAQQNTTTNTCSSSSRATNICNIIKRSKQSTENDATSDQSKHLDNNNSLGYKEENAVYKEVSCKKELLADKCGASSMEHDIELKYTSHIRWPDLFAQMFLHFGGLYGLYLVFSAAKFLTFLWVMALIVSSGVGITAGAHRLWSHKSYTAALPMRILLMFLFTIAGQRDAYTWALDHRIHHKFSESDADPHNAKRGFFFAHVGWLFLTPHPKVAEKRKIIDMSDLENDRVVMFQQKWFIPLFVICSIALPTLVPYNYWSENLWVSFWICFNLRFTVTLNIAFFVNSLAHMWGRKPYDKNISPVENPFVSFLALGEGWHNYHHVFPWDYRTGELGSYSLNITTAFIDFCAKFGWASGRKSVSPDMVGRRAAKCGDGTRFLTDDYAHNHQVWGYGDRDIPKEDVVELEQMRD